MSDYLIPVPALTRRYLRLKGLPSAERLNEAKRTSVAELADEFAQSAATFAAFPAEQDFYGARSDEGKNPKSATRTYGWAMAMKGAGDIAVDGAPELTFRYVDRELIPTRTRPRLKFAAAGGAELRVDVILANVESGRPIVAELKIAADKDPYTALVQALAAAAQLAPAAQRQRLVRHGDRPQIQEHLKKSLAGFEKDELIDVYVLLAEFPPRARDRFEQLGRAVTLAGELEEAAPGLGRVRILAVAKDVAGRVYVTTELPQQGS